MIKYKMLCILADQYMLTSCIFFSPPTKYFQFLLTKHAVTEALVAPGAREESCLPSNTKILHIRGWLRSEIYFTQLVPTLSPPMQSSSRYSLSIASIPCKNSPEIPSSATACSVRFDEDLFTWEDMYIMHQAQGQTGR